MRHIKKIYSYIENNLNSIKNITYIPTKEEINSKLEELKSRRLVLQFYKDLNREKYLSTLQEDERFLEKEGIEKFAQKYFHTVYEQFISHKGERKSYLEIHSLQIQYKGKTFCIVSDSDVKLCLLDTFINNRGNECARYSFYSQGIENNIL